jgi:hypothetical protein
MASIRKPSMKAGNGEMKKTWHLSCNNNGYMYRQWQNERQRIESVISAEMKIAIIISTIVMKMAKYHGIKLGAALACSSQRNV